MENIKLPICLYLLLAIFGCNRNNEEICPKISVNKSQFKAFVPYENLEELIFNSNTGLFDTITVTDYKLDTILGAIRECNAFELVESSFEIAWNNDMGIISNHKIDFSELSNGITNYINIYVDDLYEASSSISTENVSFKLEHFDDVQFNGNNYSNVYLFSCNDTLFCKPIDSLGFVSGGGLLFYTLDGISKEKL